MPPEQPPAPEPAADTTFQWPTSGPTAKPFIPHLLPQARDHGEADPPPAPGETGAQGNPAPKRSAPKRGTGPTLQTLAERQASLAIEVERQAATTEATLRQLSGAVKDLSATIGRLVSSLPGLVREAGGGTAVAGRLDHLEHELSSKLDRLDALASGGMGLNGVAERVGATIGTEMDDLSRQLRELGELLRAELITSTAQAEARLTHDRDQLAALIDRAVKQQAKIASEALTRDHLRQFWVEMSAKMTKLQELGTADQARLRHDVDQRLEQVRAAVATQTSSNTDVVRQLVAGLTERTAGSFDGLRREVHELAAQASVALGNETDRLVEGQERSTVFLAQQLGLVLETLAQQPWQGDIDQLRAELATAAAATDRQMRAERKAWEQQLTSTLESLGAVIDHASRDRETLVADLLGTLVKPRQPLPPSPGT